MEIAAVPTEDYVSFFLEYPIWEIFNLFLLGLARIIPIIALAPFLGGKILPNIAKIGLGVALVPIFLPIFLTKTTGPVPIDFTFALLAAKEVIIGFMLGFLVSIPFFYAQMAGTMIDHQRGAQSLQVTDPSSAVRASPLGVLYNDMMIISFFAVGGPFLFFEAIATSYTLVPPDAFFNPELLQQDNPIWFTFVKMLSMVFTIALQLAAPSLLAILMSDLFLGIANRMAPQVQISFLLWSLKAFVGIAILWASWWLVLKVLDQQSLSWIKLINKVVNSMALQS